MVNTQPKDKNSPSGQKDKQKELSILDMAASDRKEMPVDSPVEGSPTTSVAKIDQAQVAQEAIDRIRNKTLTIWIDRIGDSPLASVVNILIKYPPAQLAIFIVLSTILSLFLVAVSGGVTAASALNFLPFLWYFLGGIYFSRYSPATSLAFSATITGWAIILFGVGLSGFAPTLYFGIALILITIFAAINTDDFIQTAAEQTTLSRRLQQEVMRKDKQETHGSVKTQAGELDGFKEREMAFKKQRLLFSELFIHLRTLSVSLNEKDLFNSIHFILHKGLQVEAMEIFFLDDTGSHLFAAEAASIVDGQMESKKFDIRVRHDNENILSRCINASKSFSSKDIERDQMIKALVEKSPCNTIFCAPLIAENEVRGVLNISATGKIDLDDMERRLFTATAAVAGAALNNAKTFLLTQEELVNKELISEREKKERIKTRSLLDRIMDRKIVEEVMKNPDKTFSDRIRITTLLADVRGFTTMSEKMNPREVVELLNSFFSTLTPIIFKYGGTLDKYIGDEIMALFGPPEPKGNHAEMAILCALEMKSAFKKLQKRWKTERNITLEMGVALNTGEAIVGFIGSENLTNYTAIGDSVNTAARLEDVTPAGKIYITEFTYNDVSDFIEAKHISSVAFKGKEKVVNYYEVISLNSKSPAKQLSTPSGLERTNDKPDNANKNSKIKTPHPEIAVVSAAETKLDLKGKTSDTVQRPNTGIQQRQRPQTGIEPTRRPNTTSQKVQRPNTDAQPQQRPSTGIQQQQRPQTGIEPTRRPNTTSQKVQRPNTSVQQQQRPSTGIQQQQRPQTGIEPARRPNTTSQKVQRPNTGIQQQQRPNTGVQQQQRPQTGVEPARRPNTTSQKVQRPNTGIQQQQRPNTGVQQQQRPQTGAQQQQRPQTGVERPQSSDSPAGFCRICGTKFKLPKEQCPRCGTPV